MNEYKKTFTEDRSKMIITQEGTPFICELPRIHSSEIGTYYMFENPMNMPLLRMHAYDNIQRAYSLGYSLTDVKNGFQNIINVAQSQANNKDYDVVHIAKNMMERLQDVFTLERLYMMCTTLFIVEEDEDISIYIQSKAEEKLERWRQVPLVLGFFLQKVTTCLMNFWMRYEAIMRNYSTEPAELTEQQKSNQLMMQSEL